MSLNCIIKYQKDSQRFANRKLKGIPRGILSGLASSMNFELPFVNIQTFFFCNTMGKSAKFYKRPSKKEKEGLAVKKLVSEPVIGKKAARDTKKISVPASLFQSTKEKPTIDNADQDVDMTAAEIQTPEASDKKKDKKKEAELPDYVDLFSGKKTYKKIPKKRK